MDPQANIAEQLSIAYRINNIADQIAAGDNIDIMNFVALSLRLAELVVTLDLWRQHGGYDPYTGMEATEGRGG